jgi:CRP-like cAMP-binding protein
VDWPLLAEVPVEDVREVLGIARRRTFRRGEVVFHEGDPGDSLHLIVDGRFASRVQTRLGDVALLAVHGPGEAFGELALLSPDAPRSATVAALEPAETRAVYCTDFTGLRRRHPGVNEVLLQLLAEQVRRSNERVLEAHYLEADVRVLRRLRDLARVYRAAGDGTVTIPLTQEELAEMAGTSRATVNRVLRDEMTRGTVELRRGRTIVTDLEQLARRAR